MNQRGSIEAGLMLAPLALLLAGLLEIGLMSYSRDVLVSVASDAARATAISGDPQSGRAIVETRGSIALGGIPIEIVRIQRESRNGVSQVVVEIKAPMSGFSIFGVRGIKVLGHAIAEH